MADLSIDFAGMRLKNPVIAASATPTKSFKFFQKCIDANCGAFVAKTPSWDELERIYPCPRFYVFYPDAVNSGKFYSFYTNEQLCEYTPEEFAEQMAAILPYAREKDCRVIASIMGGDNEEWAKMTKLYDPVCEAMELNLACPYGGDLAGNKGCTVGCNPLLVEEILKIVRANTDKPIIIKLPAEGGDLTPVLAQAKRLGVAAVHTTHRYTGVEVDVETGKIIMNGAVSGYGGTWAAPISRKWVAKAAAVGNGIDICGGSGIDGWRDSVAHMMCGAKTVQMCAGPTLRGYKVFSDTVQGINDFMERKGYAKLEDFIGCALPAKGIREVPRKDVFMAKAVADLDACKGCGICPDICFYEALSMENGKVRVDGEQCDGCGLCMQMCPSGALTLMHGDQVVPTSWAGARGRKGETGRK